MTDVTVKVVKSVTNIVPPRKTSVIKVTVAGPIGPRGQDGATLVGEGAHIYRGSGVPDVGTGVDGEWYINSANADMYQKQAGVWVFILNIRGLQGNPGPAGQDGQLLVGDGANILTGDGAPDDADGTDFDLYLDDLSGDIYKKVTGSWVLQTNLRGSPGAKGDKGDQGDPGTNGTNGWSPVFAVVADGTREVLQVADWSGGTGTKPATGLYVGATGLTAIIGSAVDVRGTPGSASWTSGSGAPSNGTGVDGDFYFRTDTSQIYQKSAGAFSVIANIDGAARTIKKYTASHQLALADSGAIVEMEVAGANILSIPPHSSVALPVGTTIDVVQAGAGQTTVSVMSGVTLRSASSRTKLNQQWSGASLYQRALDEWVLMGDITT